MVNEYPARQVPSHMMRVEIPLCLTDESPPFDPVADALRLTMNISRAAYLRYICDEVQVNIERLR